jgi:tyrosine-protein kinase
MTIEKHLLALVKRWKLLVMCLVLLGLAAYIGSILMTPIYQSVALVQIAFKSNNNQSDLTSLLASDQLVQTEASLAVSDQVLHEVASHYPGLSVEQLSKHVSASPKNNTQLFEIDVQDPSPTRAAALANDIAATLIRQQIQLAQGSDVQAQQQIQQDLQKTHQQIDTISAQIAALQAGNGSTTKLTSLKVQLNSLQLHYNQLQTAQTQLEMTNAQNDNFIRVAQPAQAPLKPALPNKPLNIGIGLLAGLIMGITLALLFEQLDTHIRTPDAITQLLGWPVLASIMRAASGEEIVNPTGHNINVEQYRILRTNIGFSAIDKPLKTILVTSSTPQEGKSTIAANLAIFMARAGKKTLLIDADLRRPTQQKIFGLPAYAMGFTSAVLTCSTSDTLPLSANHQPFTPSLSPMPQSSSNGKGATSLDAFVHTVNIPNLGVMPCGPIPPNPSELLDSQAMQRFFTILDNSAAEVTIIDSPPLLGLSDASILSSKVDGTLVVVDVTHAKKGHLKQLKAILEQAGANVIGCVINKHRRDRDRSIYSAYYYYAADAQAENSHQSRKSKRAVPVIQDSVMETKQRPQQGLFASSETGAPEYLIRGDKPKD